MASPKSEDFSFLSVWPAAVSVTYVQSTAWLTLEAGQIAKIRERVQNEHSRNDRLSPFVKALRAVGWSASYWYEGNEPMSRQLEGLVHEIAHCYVLGVFTPMSNEMIGDMIRDSGDKQKRDKDEVLVTAITIQCMETYFGEKEETKHSLESCYDNLGVRRDYRPTYAAIVAHLNTERCVDLASRIFEHAQQCVNRHRPVTDEKEG